MPLETVAGLVSLLQKHSLLERAQLEEVRRVLAARSPDPLSLARELMQRDWLTPYQINQLSQGRGADLVLGNYVLLTRLGEGGMGQVFKARHRKLGKVVALKILRKDRLAGAEAVRRFYHEIRAASRLVHPNIVHAEDADEIDGAQFFAMEFVEGTDLAKLVKQQGPLPVDRACDYVRQAALGLQHAHERGLVHRDIKPANLLLARNGVVKLLDLGLARRESVDDNSQSTALTQEGSVLGTPDYIAPEQALRASSVDIRADLYSLGCSLFFLLTGQPPFPGGTLTEKLLRHQLDPPPPLAQVRPDAPPHVAAVIERLLAKRPDDRFQTPAEMVAALAPGAVPVAAEPFADLKTPLATRANGPAPSLPGSPPAGAAPTEPFTNMETPVIVAPVARAVTAAKPRGPRRLWLLPASLAVVVVAVSAVVGGKLLFRDTRPPEEPPPQNKDLTATDKDKLRKKPPPDPVKAADCLKQLGGRIEPDDYWQGDKPVTGVDLSASKAADADLVHLAAFPHLKTLNLYNVHVTDKGLAHLEHLTELTSLTLGNDPNFTDDWLRHLKGLNELQEFNLIATGVTGSGLAYLHDAQKLAKVNLGQNPKLEDGGLAHLTGRASLRMLYLHNCAKVTDKGMENLTGLTGLTDLALPGTQVTDDGLAHLQEATQLGRLELTSLKVTDAGLARFKDLSKLTELHASGTNLGDNGLAPLRTATKLETLVLTGTRTDDAGAAVFKAMPDLQVLSLTSTRVGDEGLANLAGLKKLRQLDLEVTDVTDAGLKHLKEVAELQSLNVARTQVRGPGLAELKGLSKLTALYLGGTLIDDAGLNSLAELKPVVTLSLANCRGFGNAGVTHLARLENLTTLVLSGTPIGDAGIEKLGNLKQLQSLDVRETKVTTKALDALKKARPVGQLTTYP
jgi:serine/threonine-protein kinase